MVYQELGKLERFDKGASAKRRSFDYKKSDDSSGLRKFDSQNQISNQL